jgi:hypothetical protein
MLRVYILKDSIMSTGSIVAEAFIVGESKRVGNTQTDGKHVWLFENCIARKVGKYIELTLAGCPTRTTRERLNCIQNALGNTERFYQSKYVQYFDNNDYNIGDTEKILVLGVKP